MPFLNSRGQSLHGRGGLRVSLDNKEFAVGGAVGWKTDDIAVYVTRLDPVPPGWEDPDGQVVIELDVRTGIVATAAPRGANAGAANGGVWVCQLGDRLFASTGWDQRGVYFAAVGPAGEIAYTPHAGYPLRLRYPDGRDEPLGPPQGYPIAGLQLLGGGRAIGHIDEPQFKLVTIGMPTPVTVGRVRHLAYLEVNGDSWELCWAVDQGRILLHPATSTVGYVVRNIVTEGDAFNITAIVQGANILIAWGVHEGEQAGESVSRVVDLSAPRVELGAPVIVIDPPVIHPEHPVEYHRLSPDYSAHVAKVATMFPDEWERANESTHAERTDEFIKLLASYLHDTVDKNVGNNGKRGGAEMSKDALAYKNASAPGGAEVIDVINGNGHKPTWSDATIPPQPQPGSRDGIPDGVPGRFIQPDPWVEAGEPIHPPVGDPNKGKHAYTRDDNARDECNFILPNGKQCDQPRAAAIHQVVVVDPIPDPGVPPLRPELAPTLAMLASIGIDLLATQRQLRMLPVPPPIIKEVIKEVIVEKGGGRPHPDYGQVQELAAAVDYAYQRAQRIRNPRPLSPDAMAHLLWRYVFEDYTVDQLVQEARERAGG